MMQGVELQKKFTNDCIECGESFETIKKETKYCGNCGVAAVVIMHYKQYLANRWRVLIPENRQWVRDIYLGSS